MKVSCNSETWIVCDQDYSPLTDSDIVDHSVAFDRHDNECHYDNGGNN